MLALLRRSVAALFGAALLSPYAQALQAGGDECVHLVGYGGASSTSTKPVGSRTPPKLDVGICAVDDARLNRSTPIKTSADFVPITGDDSLGFYCVYGVKASATGGVGGNVGIFLFELANGEVLLFGSGYGNISGANLFVYAVARRNGNNEYRPRLILNANGTVSVNASVLANGADPSITTTVKSASAMA